MSRSLTRLMVRSVLVIWALGLIAMVGYGRSRTWLGARAQEDGVFLAFELLDALPPTERATRLDALRPHFIVDFSLQPIDEVERRLGTSIRPGVAYPHREGPFEEWYFLAFHDGDAVLEAGPMHPTIPPGYYPVGAIVAALAFPLFAGLLAYRLERELTKVERASEAIGVGQLDARVHNEHGPSSELAASFNAMADRIEHLVRSRDELVQAVSHELGSPLCRLRFHLELLESESAPASAARIHAMERQLDDLDELVAELLGYVQTDELSISPRAFDCAQGLQDLVELARLELPDASAVTITGPDAQTQVVVADERLFLRATENLLRNALRYANTRIELQVSRTSEEVRVAVHDDGPGIPAGHRERVTRPFVRLDSDRGRDTGGVGLGLAIVRRIVERHGGRIVIGDSPLGGASVSLEWPLAP